MTHYIGFDRGDDRRRWPNSASYGATTGSARQAGSPPATVEAAARILAGEPEASAAA